MVFFFLVKFTEPVFGRGNRGVESSAPGPGRTANRCEAQIPRRPLSQTPCTPAHASAPSKAARGPGDAAPAFPPRPWPRTPCDRLRSSALPKPPSAGSPNEPEARNPTTSSAAHCPQPLSIIRQRERLSFLRHFSEPLVSSHVPGRLVVPCGPESSQTPHFPLSYSQSLNKSCRRLYAQNVSQNLPLKSPLGFQDSPWPPGPPGWPRHALIHEASGTLDSIFEVSQLDSV